MKSNLKRDKKGFTIIEVLIVLAIAGLILLIVLLAAPALQRNSRNTQIRNDANIVLGYINEFASNNNGSLPSYVCSTTNGDVSFGPAGAAIAVPATPTCTVVGKIRNSVNLSGSNTESAASAINAIVVNVGRGCALTESGADTTAANNRISATINTRAAAASYQTEGNNATTNQCVGS